MENFRASLRNQTKFFGRKLHVIAPPVLILTDELAERAQNSTPSKCGAGSSSAMRRSAAREHPKGCRIGEGRDGQGPRFGAGTGLALSAEKRHWDAAGVPNWTEDTDLDRITCHISRCSAR